MLSLSSLSSLLFLMLHLVLEALLLVSMLFQCFLLLILVHSNVLRSFVFETWIVEKMKEMPRLLFWLHCLQFRLSLSAWRKMVDSRMFS